MKKKKKKNRETDERNHSFPHIKQTLSIQVSIALDQEWVCRRGRVPTVTTLNRCLMNMDTVQSSVSHGCPHLNSDCQTIPTSPVILRSPNALNIGLFLSPRCISLKISYCTQVLSDSCQNFYEVIRKETETRVSQIQNNYMDRTGNKERLESTGNPSWSKEWRQWQLSGQWWLYQGDGGELEKIFPK